MFKKGRHVREAGGEPKYQIKGVHQLHCGALGSGEVCEQGRGRLWSVTDSQATEGSLDQLSDTILL